ncbi:MAG: hypothetical protein QG646_292 [Euryarchaeota archaeon]|nr:hypothetical protein [Euryarchaeota archaeon]
MKVTEMKSSPERPNSHNVSFRMLYNTRTCPGSTSELKSGEANFRVNFENLLFFKKHP